MNKEVITKNDIGILDLGTKVKKLHLDSEYRRRWQEYHLVDGTVKDSRVVNWRNVEWERVVKIVTYMNGTEHVIDLKDKSGFKFFMCFRWGGQEAQYKDQKYIGHTKVNLWTQGWTNGGMCFLNDVDFYTGKVVKIYKMKLEKLKGHIHPRVKGLI